MFHLYKFYSFVILLLPFSSLFTVLEPESGGTSSSLCGGKFVFLCVFSSSLIWAGWGSSVSMQGVGFRGWPLWQFSFRCCCYICHRHYCHFAAFSAAAAAAAALFCFPRYNVFVNGDLRTPVLIRWGDSICRCVASPPAKRWGFLSSMIKGNLVLSLRCTWSEILSKFCGLNSDWHIQSNPNQISLHPLDF